MHHSTKIPGVYLIKPQVHHDMRGTFYESWQSTALTFLPNTPTFYQDNVSVSRPGVLRGLHFQKQYPFAQLVYVTAGEILDCIVDLRQNSPTFGEYLLLNLSAHNPTQIWIPAGCAHGFYAISHATVQYKCTGKYLPHDEGGLFWQSLSIPWPNLHPIISTKDTQLPHWPLANEYYPQVKEEIYGSP